MMYQEKVRLIGGERKEEDEEIYTMNHARFETAEKEEVATVMQLYCKRMWGKLR